MNIVVWQVNPYVSQRLSYHRYKMDDRTYTILPCILDFGINVYLHIQNLDNIYSKAYSLIKRFHNFQKKNFLSLYIVYLKLVVKFKSKYLHCYSKALYSILFHWQIILPLIHMLFRVHTVRLLLTPLEINIYLSIQDVIHSALFIFKLFNNLTRK